MDVDGRARLMLLMLPTSNSNVQWRAHGELGPCFRGSVAVSATSECLILRGRRGRQQLIDQY